MLGMLLFLSGWFVPIVEFKLDILFDSRHDALMILFLHRR
jgi:hypothetical protein